MPLIDTLNADLRTAIKSRDQLTADTLRLTLTAIRTAETAGKTARTLTDDEITAVISAEAKKRSEAATIYRDAGRDEAAAAEEAQRDVLRRYLPEPLSSSELAALVESVCHELGATTRADMGRVIGAVRGRSGGRADGREIAEAVKQHLST